MTLSGFLLLWALHLLAAISPGPAVLMAARTGLTQGFRTGLMLSVGIGIGAVFWAALAFSGLTLLFQTAPGLLWAIRLLGGVYLIYLAIGMWRGADQPLDAAMATPLPRSALAAMRHGSALAAMRQGSALAAMRQGSALAAMRQGVVTQLTNPKTVAMFSAIFVGTVPASTEVWQYAVVLLAVFANETIWCSLVARVFSFDRSRTTYLRLKSVIDRAFGGLLLILGLKLAAS